MGPLLCCNNKMAAYCVTYCTEFA